MCGKGCLGACTPTWTSEHNVKLKINQFSLMHTNIYVIWKRYERENAFKNLDAQRRFEHVCNYVLKRFVTMWNVIVG